MSQDNIKKVKEWAEEYARENALFVVDIVLGSHNITVMADSMENITIEQCAKLSRYLHAKLEEETNLLDIYTLDVSSPGMSNSLKIPMQYEKRIGKDLVLILKDSVEMSGEVREVSLEGIKIEQTIPANKKTKEAEQKIIHDIPYTQIIKATIPFKFKK